jgi:hypothetical protein
VPKKKPKSIENAIERINLRIDDLNQNLENYEQKVDLTLKEIPKDIRSNLNSSKNPDTYRASVQLMQENMSDETLKTILDFHSERAKTQQRNRNAGEKVSQICNPAEGMIVGLPQMMMTDYQRILVTSRNSKSRHAANSGIAGIIGSDLGIAVQNSAIDAHNITHDQI